MKNNICLIPSMLIKYLKQKDYFIVSPFFLRNILNYNITFLCLKLKIKILKNRILLFIKSCFKKLKSINTLGFIFEHLILLYQGIEEIFLVNFLVKHLVIYSQFRQIESLIY